MILTTFDYILIIILLIFFVFGCIEGLVTQLYDLGSILVSCVISLIVNDYVSDYINLFPFSDNLKIYTTIFDLAQTYISFIITFLILFLIFKIIGIFIKPILKKSLNILHTTSFLNRLLGGFVSVVKGSVLIYVLVLVLMLPAFNLKDTINQSTLFKYIETYVPNTKDYVELVEEYSLIHLSKDEDLLNTMLNGYKIKVIDENRFIEIYDKNILHSDKEVTYSLTSSDKELLTSILRKKYALPAIQQTLDHIEVIDE